ncbi:hypothetical protein BES34_006415 [Leptospira inadai serovar Lyme]|uniref:Uncharacterized protein n=1 Tax=Leptospira inadai serovar Lyme TaxID=293084 RepID=A0ABX4YKK0_9LEPT|nr:hypothetical protein BES34_006415 [Leptospira inadai serovar Lyme]
MEDGASRFWKGSGTIVLVWVIRWAPTLISGGGGGLVGEGAWLYIINLWICQVFFMKTFLWELPRRGQTTEDRRVHFAHARQKLLLVGNPLRQRKDPF